MKGLFGCAEQSSPLGPSTYTIRSKAVPRRGLRGRQAEDRLGETLYSGTSAPEQHLLALAHTMLSRGLVTEEDLAKRMNAVRSRFDEV